MTHRPAIPCVLCLTLVACGGGDDGDTPPVVEPVMDDPLLVIDPDPGLGEIGVPLVPDIPSVPGGGPVEPGTGLRVDTSRLCPDVGESIELDVVALAPETADGAERERRDVSASVDLSVRYGDALELLSQGDDAIALRMTRQDIVALDIALADETSLTVQVAGFSADTPPEVLMRKPVAGGCLYALRLQEPTFCGTALMRNGQAGLGTGDTVVEIDGCLFEAPDELPVIELPPADG